MAAANGVGMIGPSFGPAPFNPTRSPGNPLIAHNSAPWENFQVQYSLLFDDANPDEFLNYYNGAGNFVVGVARAKKTDVASIHMGPWVQDPTNPIYSGAGVQPMFIDSMFDYLGTRYLYWTYFGGTGNIINLSTAPVADPLNFTLVGTMLTPSGQGRNDGTDVSSSTVFWWPAWNKWVMYYNWREAGVVLPGIRYATADAPGGPWTKQAGNVLYKSGTLSYFEGQSILRDKLNLHTMRLINGKIALLCSNFYYLDPPPWGRWVINAYCGTSPETLAPSKLNPILDYTQTANLFSAEAFYYEFNGRWYVFFQAAKRIGEYGLQNWDILGSVCAETNYFERIVEAA